jgi:hypothetical protein
MTDTTLALEFVGAETKIRQIDTITQWNWDLSCQKKRIMKIRGKVYTDHTLTSQLVAPELKIRQLGTIPKWCRNFPCQKKTIQQNFEAKVYTDTTLALEIVMVESKCLESDTIPKWFGNLTCQKKRFSKISRQKCTRVRQEAGGRQCSRARNWKNWPKADSECRCSLKIKASVFVSLLWLPGRLHSFNRNTVNASRSSFDVGYFGSNLLHPKKLLSSEKSPAHLTHSKGSSNC